MKRLLLALILLSGVAFGQQNNTTNTNFTNGLGSSKFFNIPRGTTPPTTGILAGSLFYHTTLGLQYYNGTIWQTVGISGSGVTSFNSRTGAITPLVGDYPFYVPYTGATSSLNLGANSLIAQGLTIAGNSDFSAQSTWKSGSSIRMQNTANTQFVNLQANSLTSSYIASLPSKVGSQTFAMVEDLTSYIPVARTITINGTTQDLSANRTFTVTTGNITGLQDSLTKKANRDMSNVANGAIPITKLASSTISGVNLGGNLSNLSPGYGLTGTAYNGGTARTFVIDTTSSGLQTVANFFPKGDTRYARLSGSTNYIQNQFAAKQTSPSRFWIDSARVDKFRIGMASTDTTLLSVGGNADFKNTNSSFASFWRTNQTGTNGLIKSRVGQIGNAGEFSTTYNQDYRNGEHHFDDSTKYAVWTGMSYAGLAVQVAAPGSNTGDVWTNSGSKYSFNNDPSGKTSLNSSLANPLGDGLLWLNRYLNMPSISGGGIANGLGADSLHLDGGRTRTTVAPIVLNKSNTGNVLIPNNSSVGIGTSTPYVSSGYNTVTLNGTNGGLFTTQVNGTNAFRAGADTTGGGIVEPRNLPINVFTNGLLTATFNANNTFNLTSLTNGLVKSTSGTLSNATAGTDYVAPAALSSYLPLAAGSGSPLSGVLYQTKNGKISQKSPVTGTEGVFEYYSNTEGDLYLGIESSAGNAVLIGGIAYSTSLGTGGNTALNLGTGSNVRYSISSTGNHDFKSGTATFGGALTAPSATFSGNISAASQTITTTPTTSAGTYDILTRNTSTGVVEKIASSSLPTLASGTYVPTLTNGANVVSSSVVNAWYSRNGSIVTGAIEVSVTLTAISTASIINIGLPVSSNLTSTSDFYANVTEKRTSSEALASVSYLVADTFSDNIKVEFESLSGLTKTITFTFQYIIK